MVMTTLLRPLALVFGLLILAEGAQAQDAGIKRMVLQRTDVVGTAYECVLGKADIPPGMSIGRHTHHGVEVGYIAAGAIELMIEGQGTLHLKAGDSYTIPAGLAHDAANMGSTVSTAMATWVVEKGKPLSVPAP